MTMLGGKRLRGMVAAVAAAIAGCATDGGGRGTGISESTIAGNIAGTTAATVDALAPVCPALDSSGTVAVRGTRLVVPIEPDCRFEIAGVPAGDAMLDFETKAMAASLSIKGIPPSTVVTLRDVRLRESKTDVSAISVAPAASGAGRFKIVADPPSGAAPVQVQFSFGPRPANGARVRWRFGDSNAESKELTPKHRYAAAGEYVVSLQVFDAAGLAGEAFTVVRARQAPAADSAFAVRFSGEPQSGPPPLPVTFQVAVANEVEPVKFEVDFGDGSAPASGTSRVFSHTYAKAGSYTALVTAKDGSGRVAGDSFPVVAERDLVAVRSLEKPAPIAAW